MSDLTPAKAREKHRKTFERFWAAYPRHTHINEAAKTWANLMEQGADPVKIVKAARLFAERTGTDLKYCPGPHRWLGAGQYDDADLFEDEHAGIKTWFQQQSRTANVRAVEDRYHITMPKTYPPDDLTDSESIRFWYTAQAKAWIREVYERKFECPTGSQPTTSEPKPVSSEHSLLAPKLSLT
jgi:hypothetical protein